MKLIHKMVANPKTCKLALACVEYGCSVSTEAQRERYKEMIRYAMEKGKPSPNFRSE